MSIFGSIIGQFKNKLGAKSSISFKEDQRPVEGFENVYYEIEDLLCFERAIRFCYASLGMLVHNRAIRQQCGNFLKWSLSHEEDLEKILADSLAADVKIEKTHQAYTLPTDDLTVESILSLGLVVTGYRLNIYNDLRSRLSVKSRILLNHLIAHASDEMKFFQREKEMLDVDDVLCSLN